jgi:uncharacterized protein YpmB
MAKNAAKIAWLCAAVVVAVVLAAALYYMAVQRPLWNERERAARLALSETPLESIDRTYVFNGEASYQVMIGKDRDGREWIVWVDDEGGVLTAAMDEGISEQEVRNLLRERHPEADVLRAVPGFKDGETVWEVYYRQRDKEGGTRLYYDYYRFRDGEWLETYTLAKK